MLAVEFDHLIRLLFIEHLLDIEQITVQHFELFVELAVNFIDN